MTITDEVAAPLKLCQVGVAVGDNTLREVSLAANFGLDAVIEDLVDVLTAEGLLPADNRAAYALCRADATPLDHERSLEDHGIKNGAVLYLLPAESARRFGPVIEEISTAVARVNMTNLPVADNRTWRGIVLGLSVAAVGLTEAMFARLWWHLHGFTPALASWVLTLVLVWAGRRARHVTFGWCAIVAASAAAALSVPAPPSAYHLVAAGGVATIGIGVLAFLTGRYVTAATATSVVGVVFTSVALIHAVGWNVTSPRLGVAVLLCVLGLVTWADALGVLASGIPRPWIASITNKGIFTDTETRDEVTTVNPTPTLTIEQVTVLGRRADQATTGFLLGAGVLAVAAAWFAAGPRTWGFVVFIGGVCWVIGLRARAYVDRWCVTILAVSAPAAAAAAITRLSDPALSSTLTCVGLIAALAGLCALMMVALPKVKVSAPINKAIEISEYFPCLVLSVPWALWLLGVWPVLRNLVP